MRLIHFVNVWYFSATLSRVRLCEITDAYLRMSFIDWQCNQLSAIAAVHPPAWSVGKC